MEDLRLSGPDALYAFSAITFAGKVGRRSRRGEMIEETTLEVMYRLGLEERDCHDVVDV